MTGGKQELELHVDIKIERDGGKGKGFLTGGRHELELHV